MIKRILLTCFVLCFLSGFTSNSFAQDTIKTNPVLFYEGYLGVAFSKERSLAIGQNLNYQFRQHLLTARYHANIHLEMDWGLFLLIPFPVVQESRITEEFAFMYGQRIIQDGNAFSLSGGISFNKSSVYQRISATENFKKKDSYPGIPFEANFKIFHNERKRYRIYGLIPIGSPTGFGRSIGLKLFGNISKNSYAGAGLTYGLGFHKKY